MKAFIKTFKQLTALKRCRHPEFYILCSETEEYEVTSGPRVGADVIVLILWGECKACGYRSVQLVSSAGAEMKMARYSGSPVSIEQGSVKISPHADSLEDYALFLSTGVIDPKKHTLTKDAAIEIFKQYRLDQIMSL